MVQASANHKTDPCPEDKSDGGVAKRCSEYEANSGTKTKTQSRVHAGTARSLRWIFAHQRLLASNLWRANKYSAELRMPIRLRSSQRSAGDRLFSLSGPP